MPRTPLSHTPAFRGIREQILTRYSETLTCPDCGLPVELNGWTVHRNQLCEKRNSTHTT